MPNSNFSQTLLTAAEAYIALNYSIIPIWGERDPAQPKVAGVEWGQYQRRRAAPAEIHRWFANDQFGGIAIVTGSISRLVVLDFDTEERFKAFQDQHPDLTQNHVIQTRRGFHVYYYLQPHLHLPSRKGPDLDLLSEGRYVVARPTCVDGYTYKLIRGGQPKTLSQFDIQRITRFLDESSRFISTKCEITPFSYDSNGVQTDHKVQPYLQTVARLLQTYQTGLKSGRGRNEALFQTALQARDAGWTLDEVLAGLASFHVSQPAPAKHRKETPAQRYIETRKTVQSAFSRPPRHQEKSEHEGYSQIPNSVREYLLNCGETRTERLLDGLRLKGIAPRMEFTTKQALELLKGIVGRDSIYAALKVITSSGEAVFKRKKSSPLNPPSTANAATDTRTKTNKCFIGREEKSGKSPNHRPAIHYIMPSNDDLCARFGVKSSPSDAITLEDLSTAKQTRMALHRELIRRRPDIYPRRWLARRLGVSCKTLDVYNRETEGVCVRPCFWEQPIYWSNLNAVPDSIEIRGAVLQDETGKRYPARRTIAAILLGQGKQIIYRRQDANYYWYDNTPQALNPNGGRYPIQSKVTDRLKVIQATDISSLYVPYTEPVLLRRFVVEKQPHMELAASHLDTNESTARSVIRILNPSKRRESRLRYQKPLTEQGAEYLAQKIYTQTNQRSQNTKGGSSQATARRLVITYGAQLVEQGLAVIAQRKNIANPTGFLVTWLRSESRRQ